MRIFPVNPKGIGDGAIDSARSEEFDAWREALPARSVLQPATSAVQRRCGSHFRCHRRYRSTIRTSSQLRDAVTNTP